MQSWVLPLALPISFKKHRLESLASPRISSAERSQLASLVQSNVTLSVTKA